ncbi:MAG: hypothetical protein ACK5HT_07870, partial [Draconibacterium sp.]
INVLDVTILFSQVKVSQHQCSDHTGMPGFDFNPERKEVDVGRDLTLSPVSPFSTGKDDRPLQATKNHKA